jgi:preprotein translocase subunit SecA
VSFDYEAVDELLQKECKHKFITITNLTHAYFGKTVCVNCEIEYKKYLEQENADLRAKLAEKDDFIMEQNKVIKHFNEEYAPATEYIKIAESFIDSHKKLEELYPKLLNKNDELQAKLKAAEIKIDELQTRNTVLFNTRQNIQAVLDMVRHELDETYIDENGTTCTRPTAWAYYAVCKAGICGINKL